MHLASLGLSNATMSLIWLVGPLAGTFIQPLMGIWSNSLICRWGRRIPFVIGGTIGVLIGLVILSEAQEFARLTGLSSRVIAIAGVWTILLSVQPLQMGARALIAEQSPARLVSQTNGWASRWVGFGSVSGYLLGVLNLGHSMKALYATAAALLVLSVSTTCCVTCEYPGLDEYASPIASRTISPAIRQIFKVQLLAWLAWFPFLYYGSTYVTAGAVNGVEESLLVSGSFGMFLFALVALCFNLILPQVLPYFEVPGRPESNDKRRGPLVTLWMIGQLSYSSIMFCAPLVKGEGRLVLVALAGFNWSLSQWAPFTLINQHLHNQEMDAGIVLSLHNAAISSPQILSALLTAGVLWICRRLGTADESGILLGLTAIPSLLAAYQAGRIEDSVMTRVPTSIEYLLAEDINLAEVY